MNPVASSGRLTWCDRDLTGQVRFGNPHNSHFYRQIRGMYGISTHVAALLVLERRGLREPLPLRTFRYLPVHMYWYVWKKWARFLPSLVCLEKVGKILATSTEKNKLGTFLGSFPLVKYCLWVIAA